MQTVRILEDKITSLEHDLQDDKISKKYSALLKVFEEWQNTWKSESDHLRKLLFSEGDQELNLVSQQSIILPLDKVKLIVEEALKDSEQRNNN